MRRILALTFILVGLPARAEPDRDLMSLVEAADALGPVSTPQGVFEEPAAVALRDALLRDVETNAGAQLTGLLKSRPPESIGWQTAARLLMDPATQETILADDPGLLDRAFLATVKPGDHWLNHAPPRGHVDPYGFRKALARMIHHHYKGSPPGPGDYQTLTEGDPVEWLDRVRNPEAEPENPAVPAPGASTRPAGPAGEKTRAHPSAPPPAGFTIRRSGHTDGSPDAPDFLMAGMAGMAGLLAAAVILSGRLKGSGCRRRLKRSGTPKGKKEFSSRSSFRPHVRVHFVHPVHSVHPGGLFPEP